MAKEFEILTNKYEDVIVKMTSNVVAGEHITTSNTGDYPTVGFTLVDVPRDKEGTVVIHASKVKAVKTAAQAVKAGQHLWWDKSAKKVTTVAGTTGPGGNKDPYIGVAYRDAGAADTHVYMIFDGRYSFLKT